MKRKREEKKVSAGEGLRVPEPEMLELSSVQMAPYNPRTMSAEKMAALKASLLKHGMVLGLVVQRSSEQYGPMVLVGGHQRVRAMREICASRGWALPERVGATVLDVGDADAKQLNVALNNIEGDFDPFKLGELFASVRGSMTAEDVLATGFTQEQVDEMLAATMSPDEQAALLEQNIGDLEGFARSVTLSVEFDTVEQRDEAKTLLSARAKVSGVKAGAVVVEAVRALGAGAPEEVQHGARKARKKKVVDERA